MRNATFFFRAKMTGEEKFGTASGTQRRSSSAILSEARTRGLQETTAGTAGRARSDNDNFSSFAVRARRSLFEHVASDALSEPNTYFLLLRVVTSK